ELGPKRIAFGSQFVTLGTHKMSEELFPVLEVSAVSSLWEISREVLQLPFGKFRLRGLRVSRQVSGHIAHRHHRAGHAPPVSWKSADVGILSRFRRGGESQLNFLAGRSEFARVQNFGGSGNVKAA